MSDVDVNAESVRQLRAATASGKTVTLGGQTYVVRPLKYRQTVEALQLIPPLLGLIYKMQGEGMQEASLQDFLAAAPGTLERLTCMCCAEITPPWFESAETDDALTLMTAVWEVNQDFFGQKLLPLLKSAGLAASFAKLKQLGSSE